MWFTTGTAAPRTAAHEVNFVTNAYKKVLSDVGCNRPQMAATYAVSNPTNGTVTLVNGRTARFIPAAGFAGLASFKFIVTNTPGYSMDGIVNVRVLEAAVPPARLSLERQKRAALSA